MMISPAKYAMFTSMNSLRCEKVGQQLPLLISASFSLTVIRSSSRDFRVFYPENRFEGLSCSSSSLISCFRPVFPILLNVNHVSNQRTENGYIPDTFRVN